MKTGRSSPNWSQESVQLNQVLRAWWPLAASWLLMALESPAVTAVIARLAEPEINLAAWGGVVLPLALLIEAPVIMLLAASTALSRDYESFLRLRRFMMGLGASYTVIHFMIAFTPLYDLIVSGILGVPEAVADAARVGMRLMIPWTWSIAFRRFNQGVLIRYGNSQAVGIGTIIRLSADVIILTAGWLWGRFPGTMVAGVAISCGVILEAIYAGAQSRPVIQNQLRCMPAAETALTFQSLIRFYIPLALTSLITFIMQPMGSAAISRMPETLASLAVWPAVSGLMFVLRSGGMAFNEVVVALLEEPSAYQELRRFALYLTTGVTCLLFGLASNPAADYWFHQIMGLSPTLTAMAHQALWYALPIPALSVLQSWYQGQIVVSGKTRGITEAITISLIVSGVILLWGVITQTMVGLYMAWFAFSVGGVVQIAWLRFRNRQLKTLPISEVQNKLSEI